MLSGVITTFLREAFLDSLIDTLFSQNYDREKVIRSMLRIDTSSSVEPGISVLSLLKVVLHLWRNVVLVHPDELVAIVPHWC